MNRILVNNIFRFVFLVLLQGLILINVNFLDGFSHSLPYIYIFFILMLPFRTSPSIVLLVSFLIGLAVDLFYSTPGVHASASVVVAFLREYLIRTLAPRDYYEPTDRPTIHSMGIMWYLQYSIILVVIHHAWLFSLDSIGAFDFWTIVKKTFFSSIFTFILLVIAQFLTTKKRST